MLHNPWGLLALLAIPAILALHFFRSRHALRRVGGLHLWTDAATRQPAGRKRQQLLRSLALIFELLAATILALLIAGLDWPRARSERHTTLLLDDSASMQAIIPGGESVAARARTLIGDWAEGPASSGDRYTLVAAGLRPRVLAGPFASQPEMLQALATWQPEAPAADFNAALNLAGKFIEEGQRALLVTDDSGPLDYLAESATDAATSETSAATTVATPVPFSARRLAEVAALGRPAENFGIVQADRLRVAAMRDRLVVTVQSWSGRPARPMLRATIGGQMVHEEAIDLASGALHEVRFETPQTVDAITIALPDDALLADNAVTLLPVRTKPVRVARIGLDGLAGALTRAIGALRETYVTEDPARADLVFAEGLAPQPAPANRLFVRFNHGDALGDVKLHQGEAFERVDEHPLLESVAFEGVLWPAFLDLSVTTGGLAQGPYRTLMRSGDAPLILLQESPETAATRAGLVAINLKWRQSNLTRTPAWPMLVQACVEEARRRIPGPARANFRAGEVVRLELESTALPTTSTTIAQTPPSGRIDLLRAGAVVATFDQPPQRLEALPPGDYQLRQGDAILTDFRVNLLAPGEGDLRAIQRRDPDFAALQSANVRQAGTDPLLFFILMLLLIACVGGAWTCQDRSR